MTAEPVVFKGRAGRIVGDRWTAVDSRGTVLLLHGGGQTRHSWRRSGARLADAGWTSIAIDSRGHGDSDWASDGDYTLDALIGDLTDVIDQLGTTPVLVGASMGGMTSLVAEGESPGLCSALVLVDIAPRNESAGIDRIISFMEASPHGFASLEEVADAVAAYNPNRPRPTRLDGLRKNVRQRDDGRWYWHWDPAFLTVRDESSRGERVERPVEAASHITVPTMLVRGLHSDVVSEAGAAQLRELVPHAVIREAKAGHMVAGDDNDVFAAQVVEFLADFRIG